MSYEVRHEPEFEGKKSSHPYVWYIGLTVVLFLFLLFMAWVALENGWIPKR